MKTKEKILDIAMNLNRIGNWADDDYLAKRERILFFLEQTSNSLKLLTPSIFPQTFRQTFSRFLNEYSKLEKAGKSGPINKSEWAEAMMTWGNILTHRAKLL